MIKTLSKRNFSKLTDNHLAIIDDKAYYSNNELIWSNLISTLKKFINKNILLNIPLFSPASTFIMAWSIILLLINILNFLLTPIELSFTDFINENLNLIIKKTSLIFFLIDISV